MGFDLHRRNSHNNNNMKAYIALACLAAVALAEPEAYRYGGYRGGYGGYRGGYGGYRGYRGYGKRSADAESEPKADADPWYTTYGYGLHAPLAYGYGYPSVYSGVHYYGKRSADAEPEAKADPWYTTYGYGLHAPLAYGYGYPSVYS